MGQRTQKWRSFVTVALRCLSKGVDSSYPEFTNEACKTTAESSAVLLNASLAAYEAHGALFCTAGRHGVALGPESACTAL